MIIGVPKEIKDNEFRVALVPSGARSLKDAGHRVLVEKGAGAGSAITDAEYEGAGAEVVSAKDAWGAGLVVKVKEPRPSEYAYFREGLSIFTFFHLAADPGLGEELIKKGVTAIAYETLEAADGSLPVLAPMSEVAGRLSVQVGAHYLMKSCGGRGVLLSGVPGVERGHVAILGAGVVGVNAARIAVGLNAHVTMCDTRAERLRRVEEIFGSTVATLSSSAHNIELSIKVADLVIGAVHVPGNRTPKLIRRDMLKTMKQGAVIVDVSVDQGGCIETIRPTTHSDPVYEIEGVIHYGVANMPGAVPRTSTFALTNATLPYLLTLADFGVEKAISEDAAIKKAINIHKGRVTHPGVALALSKDFCRL